MGLAWSSYKSKRKEKRLTKGKLNFYAVQSSFFDLKKGHNLKCFRLASRAAHLTLLNKVHENNVNESIINSLCQTES